MQATETKTILVASRDPQLADVRKSILEREGFLVIAASDSATVEKTCQEGNVKLVMLGYSLPPADKRRIWKAAREKCKVPILELYRDGLPEVLDQNVFYHESRTPEDFVETVRSLTSRKPS